MLKPLSAHWSALGVGATHGSFCHLTRNIQIVHNLASQTATATYQGKKLKIDQ